MGCIDLLLIAGLHGKPARAIVAELGDLVYHDPASRSWQTAAAYLSVDVRAQLAAALAAGHAYARNAEAVRAVQPEDVLPDDINRKPGVPWVPATAIRDFAARLFGVAPSSACASRPRRAWTLARRSASCRPRPSRR
jgi:N12 class adenine-specific DNA methylase